MKLTTSSLTIAGLKHTCEIAESLPVPFGKRPNRTIRPERFALIWMANFAT
ncbi:MAG TPA: hypothetical protein O0W80_01135 [Methanocorpusculum sp.]|nr:hypothetical protein [Methanocorpusculum sp.]